MKQTYACRHCGVESPTVFLVFLHLYTHHLHINIGLPACESKLLLEKCEISPKISTRDSRN